MSLTALDPDTRRDRVARWSALGCLVHVEVADERVLDDACVLAVEVLRDVDETASRFRADSDLSAVNARPGAWVRVDPLLVAAVEVAVEAAEQTSGLVHPLLGRPLVSLGYDRTFTRLEERSHLGLATAATAASSATRDAWREIAWREDAVRIPSGTALDLGATAKAWCADLIAAAWRERLGLDDALVSVGGDLRTLGERPWPVAITERPPTEPDPAPLMVEATGALATSSTRVRRWRRGGVEHHHLLDPRTGLPAVTPWRTVTALAATCVEANTATTAALVLGAEAPAWLARPDTPGQAARLVAADGATTLIDWPQGRSPEEGR